MSSSQTQGGGRGRAAESATFLGSSSEAAAAPPLWSPHRAAAGRQSSPRRVARNRPLAAFCRRTPPRQPEPSSSIQQLARPVHLRACREAAQHAKYSVTHRTDAWAAAAAAPQMIQPGGAAHTRRAATLPAAGGHRTGHGSRRTPPAGSEVTALLSVTSLYSDLRGATERCWVSRVSW